MSVRDSEFRILILKKLRNEHVVSYIAHVNPRCSEFAIKDSRIIYVLKNKTSAGLSYQD
jgi:hypothetical protein